MTRENREGNETLREDTNVTSVIRNLEKSALRWYGHIARKGKSYRRM
jgi:hypothetical protein